MEKAWRPEWPPDRRFLQTWSLSTGKNETGIPGTLNRFFRPGCRSTPSASLSIPRTSRTGHRKLFLSVSKKWQNRFPIFIRKAVFWLFWGLDIHRWGDFEKPALKSPETRMNTKKNRGDNNFVTHALRSVDKKIPYHKREWTDKIKGWTRNADCVQAQPGGRE